MTPILVVPTQRLPEVSRVRIMMPRMSASRSASTKPRLWVVIASFFDARSAKWIDDFISDDRITFRKILNDEDNESWHFKTRRTTSLRMWLGHFRQARAAFRARPDGIICAFPQLTMCAALLRKFSFHKPPIIGYHYNLGGFPAGIRGWLARWVANEVECFVVHSPAEVDDYASYMRVSRDRIRFVPLQRGDPRIERREDTENPFLLAMGSAHRDYPTLIKAVDALGIPTRIITRKADIADLPQSPYVTFLSDMTLQECNEMLAEARLSVTPINNQKTASGQVTFVTAMRLGVPVIATRSPGTEGYIEHDDSGLLVAPGDVEEMTSAIKSLWGDKARRDTLAARGKAEADARFSDEAVGTQLQKIIVEIDPELC